MERRLQLTAVVDFGSSAIKTIYRVELEADLGRARKMNLHLMLPHVTQNYPTLPVLRHIGASSPRPEDDGWVQTDDGYRLLGRRALERQENAGTSRCQERPKTDDAIYQLLGVVGSIAQRERLPEEFALNLGILLPIGESNGASSFETRVKELLPSFFFRGQQYRLSLKRFNSYIEGTGLATKARAWDYLAKKRDVPRLRDCTVAFLMMGYRNASFFCLERERLINPTHTELGFSTFIRDLNATLPNQIAEDALAEAVCGYSARQNPSHLQRIARQQDKRLRASEIEAIEKAISEQSQLFLQDFFNHLHNFLIRCSSSVVDELVLSGGTSRVFRRSIQEYIRETFPKISLNWCNAAEILIKRELGDHPSMLGRLVDPYGTFLFHTKTTLRTTKVFQKSEKPVKTGGKAENPVERAGKVEELVAS